LDNEQRQPNHEDGDGHGHDHHLDQGGAWKAGPAGAQTLLLLDTPGAGSVTWNAVLGPLSEQFRIIRPVRSSALRADAANTDIAALGKEALEALDAAGCARAHIAGCGLGGCIALWLAIHHPLRVARIALIGATASPKDAAVWIDLAARLRRGEIESTKEIFLRHWLTPALRERDAALGTMLSDAIAASQPANLASACEAFAKCDLREDLGRVAAPLLVLSGEEDAFFDASAAEAMAAVLPQGKFERIAQAAHLVTLEQPAKAAKALLDHFGSAANLEIGFRSRRVALGDAHVDKTIAAITPFTRSFQDFLTRYCWGEVWTRSGLSRRDRSLATISAIVALGAEHEVPVHVRAGLRHGMKIEEFPALYEQLALYTGLPRAFGALNITQRTLIEDGLLPAIKV